MLISQVDFTKSAPEEVSSLQFRFVKGNSASTALVRQTKDISNCLLPKSFIVLFKFHHSTWAHSLFGAWVDKQIAIDELPLRTHYQKLVPSRSSIARVLVVIFTIRQQVRKVVQNHFRNWFHIDDRGGVEWKAEWQMAWQISKISNYMQRIVYICEMIIFVYNTIVFCC